MSFNVAACAPAQATPGCLPRERLVEQLAREFDERPIVMGLMASGNRMELFVAPGGASWTVVVTRPGAVSCLLLSGTGLMPVIEPPRAPELTP